MKGFFYGFYEQFSLERNVSKHFMFGRFFGSNLASTGSTKSIQNGKFPNMVL
jgi:hypothetical protein